MTTSRQKCTQKFKDDAVDLFLTSDRPIVQVAESVGVKAGTVGNWIKEYRAEHPAKFTTEEPGSVSWAQHQAVMVENARLKQENEFLGKVSAFFEAKRQ